MTDIAASLGRGLSRGDEIVPLSKEEVRQIAVEAALEAALRSTADAAMAGALEAARLIQPYRPSQDELEEIVGRTVQKTLVQLGITANDPIETQKDMQHLRAWRTSVEEVKKKGLTALVGLAVSGIIAALWLGFKDLLHR